MSESAASPTDAQRERRSYIIEILTAILLGLASIGAAYAAYQASLYDGNSLDKYSEGISKAGEASGKQLEAQGGFTLDMITWMEWQSRIIANGPNDVVAQSIYDDFMEERLKLALEWSEKESKGKTYAHPMDSPDYAVELFSPAITVQETSAAAMAEARKANDTGDQFTFVTVLYTIVLFFAGIATVFKRDPVKLSLLVMGLALFVLSTFKLLQLPAAS